MSQEGELFSVSTHFFFSQKIRLQISANDGSHFIPIFLLQVRKTIGYDPLIIKDLCFISTAVHFEEK